MNQSQAVQQVSAHEKYSRGMKIYVMVLLSLLYIFDFADRYIIVSIFPFIKQEYALSDAQCGLLLSIVTWAVAILIIPAGAIIDRWSRKKALELWASSGAFVRGLQLSLQIIGSCLHRESASAPVKRDTCPAGIP